MLNCLFGEKQFASNANEECRAGEQRPNEEKTIAVNQPDGVSAGRNFHSLEGDIGPPQGRRPAVDGGVPAMVISLSDDKQGGPLRGGFKNAFFRSRALGEDTGLGIGLSMQLLLNFGRQENLLTRGKLRRIH